MKTYTQFKAGDRVAVKNSERGCWKAITPDGHEVKYEFDVLEVAPHSHAAHARLDDSECDNQDCIHSLCHDQFVFINDGGSPRKSSGAWFELSPKAVGAYCAGLQEVTQ